MEPSKRGLVPWARDTEAPGQEARLLRVVLPGPHQEADVAMKVERREHQGWKDEQRINREHPELLTDFPMLVGMFGRWQYIYTGAKGRISLVELHTLYRSAPWEIYCLEGELFEDVERFNTKDEAEERVKELMGEEIEP